MALEVVAAAALEAGAKEAAVEAAKQLAEKIAVESVRTMSEVRMDSIVRDVAGQQSSLSVEQLSEGKEMHVGESAEDIAADSIRTKIEYSVDGEKATTSVERTSVDGDGMTEGNPDGGDVSAESEAVRDGQSVDEGATEQADQVEGVDDKQAEIEADKRAYVEDIKSRSPCPETIDEESVCESDFKRISPEENAEMRMEFDEKKEQLIKEWEQQNGREWPRYETDVYSENGHLIRKAGMRYDAHHIKPLCMGGENTAENITPLHAEDHYDHQGVHASDSSYSKLMKEV